jgi:hypothetical protein
MLLAISSSFSKKYPSVLVVSSKNQVRNWRKFANKISLLRSAEKRAGEGAEHPFYSRLAFTAPFTSLIFTRYIDGFLYNYPREE